MSLPPRIAPDEALKALALGAVGLLARQRKRDLMASLGWTHSIPDLTGHPVEEIVNAVLATLVAAHNDDAPIEDGTAPPSCASCVAVIDLASHYGDPTHMDWPDPVRRLMADILDAELAERRK